MPRRVILALLILLGLFLRLWGLSWPREEIAPFYPEWGEEVIANLSVLKLVYREVIWTQGLYGLAYLIKGILAGAAGWVEVWLGLAKVSSEVSLPSLLAGRLAVALMGTAQIWLAYQVARRWFNSLGTGLLAAAWLAVSPLMVMESHYLATGVPLGFMSLICLWCAYGLQNNCRWWHFMLAGVCLGLTITVKASGILIAPVCLWAAWLAWRRRRPSWRLCMLWVWCFLLGLWLGLSLGSPGFVLMLFRMHRNVWNSLILPPLLDGAGWQYVIARAHELYGLVNNWVGWLWLGLWLAGLAALIVKKNLFRFSLVFFPVLYLACALCFLTSPLENLLAAIMPLFIILAAWPVVLVCRRIPRLSGWALAAIAVILLSYPLLNSLRIGYLFWQQPALSSALNWAEDNLPQRPGFGLDDASGYLLLPVGVDPGNMQLIKSFDMVSDWAPQWLSQGMPVARPYNLFGRQPMEPPRQPLSYARLPLNLQAPFNIVFADHMAYSRNESGIFMEKPMVAQRLLRFQGSPALKIRLRNLGHKLAIVQIQQGPWLNRVIELYPGQETSLDHQARAWPLLMGSTFPISFRLHQGEQVWADWQWDPLQSAFQESMQNRPLSLRLENINAFEARLMLLLHASRTGNWQQADKLLAELDPAPLQLAQDQDNPQWLARLADYAGLNRQYLLNASQVIYPVTDAAENRQHTRGHGFPGIVRPRPQDQDGWLNLLLEDHLSVGHWQLGIMLKERALEPLLVELWAKEKIGQVLIPQGANSIHIPFTQTENASPLRLKIKLPTAPLAHISLACDLKAHMRQLNNWYLEARARMHTQARQYGSAIACLQAMSGKLESQLLYLQLNALAQSGAVEQALTVAEKLETLWHDFPNQLVLLREAYQALGQNQRLPGLDRRIADLKPSISKNTVFVNGLALLGYDGPPVNELMPGKLLNYNFYWQAASQPYIDAEVFMQLIGPGTNIMQSSPLSANKHLMTSLKPGQVLRESRRFTLPETMAPGSYRLIMGLWDKEHKNQRLNVVEGEARGRNDLQLFSLEIK